MSEAQARIRRRWRRWTADEDREGCRLRKQGISLAEIARRLDRHPDIVKRRNRDVWKLPTEPTVWIDEEFFDVWNPTMAYVLGFILADGCLKRDGKWVSITQMEKPILEDIARAMQHRGRIYQEKRGAYRLEFRSKRAWKRLSELGLVPAKSKVAILPPAPRECLPHLVRGYFDGNGAVCVREGGKKPLLSVSIATGSSSLKAQLDRLLQSELGIVCSFSEYELRIQGHRQAKRFLFWLYANTDRSLYLKRKYVRFASTLDRRIAWVRRSA